MKLTKEKAIEFFKTRAPKAWRGKEVETVEEFIFDEERNCFLINGRYFVRYIAPEAMNPLMRNQNFNPTLRGYLAPKGEAKETADYWTSKGWKAGGAR